MAHVRLNDLLALIIESRRGFVEDEDRRVGRQCPRDSKPLALATREIGSALLNHGFVALAELRDKFVSARKPSGGYDLRV